MNRANALRSSVAPGALLRVVAMGGALAIGSTLPAEAARYWTESDTGYFTQQQVVQPPRRQQRARTKAPSKKETQVKDTTVHPQMPLIINVSIAQQKVRVYDANGLFAEAPVSTGMPGHATPMGVFSVIEKDRYHHSNIYSGAPMPYMQRITWGGVALHEGVLPGHPASHGCIRMPGAFAVKMWGWTKMGARVIVTPGELSPTSFAHALLPTMKVVPQPTMAEVDPVAAKADKGAPELKPIEAKLELRTTVGHSDNAKPADEMPPARTADAKQTSTTSATMTDASPAAAEPARETPAKADEAKSDAARVDSAKPEDATSDEAKPGENKPDTARAEATAEAPKDTTARDASARPGDVADAAKPEDRTVSAEKPAEAKPAELKAAEPVTAETKPADVKPEAKPETAKADAPKPDTPKPDTPKPDAIKVDAAKPAGKPAEPVKAANDATLKDKDQTRLFDKNAKEAKRREEQRKGHIAVFISRKDSKLYVRQNFAPLFEVPVTIAPSDRPIGTHVFTAEVDKTDSNVLHWTVVTVPPSARAAMRASDEPRSSRHKGKPAPVEAKAQPLPDSPAEALDRITIPPEVMTRISEVMTSGGSIVVSDQGIAQGETGEYTDFIVRYY